MLSKWSLLQLHENELVVALVAEEDLDVVLLLERLEVGRALRQLPARGREVEDVALSRFHTVAVLGQRDQFSGWLLRALKPVEETFKFLLDTAIISITVWIQRATYRRTLAISSFSYCS